MTEPHYVVEQPEGPGRTATIVLRHDGSNSQDLTPVDVPKYALRRGFNLAIGPESHPEERENVAYSVLFHYARPRLTNQVAATQAAQFTTDFVTRFLSNTSHSRVVLTLANVERYLQAAGVFHVQTRTAPAWLQEAVPVPPIAQVVTHLCRCDSPRWPPPTPPGEAYCGDCGGRLLEDVGS